MTDHEAMPQRHLPHARRRRRAGGTPLALLPTFVVGALAMVLAIVAMARIDNGWADAAAVALLLAITGVFLMSIRHLLDRDEGDERP